jgi:hypothetical protein
MLNVLILIPCGLITTILLLFIGAEPIKILYDHCIRQFKLINTRSAIVFLYLRSLSNSQCHTETNSLSLFHT